MEAMRRYQFGFVKAAAGAELLQRLLNAVGPRAAGRARFVLEDRDRGASAVARAIKKHPELARFETSLISQNDGTTRRVLTNVEGHHAAGTAEPVSPEILLAIGRGVPRSYPFRDAEIFFIDHVAGLSSSATPYDLPALEGWNLFGEEIPHVSYTVGWSPSGYRAFVHATSSLGLVGPQLAQLPAPSTAAKSWLSQFGKAKTLLMLRRTRDEAAAFAEKSSLLRATFHEWKERVKQEMSTLALPHALPVEGTGIQYSPMTLPHKPTLTRVFGPRGYRYDKSESGHGVFALCKHTKSGNRLELGFDVGSRWRHYSGGLTVVGAEGRCYVNLPAHPLQPHTSFDVGSDEAWLQLVENVAILVDHLERSFVPEVEARLGPAPAWFE